ncbi:MAG: DUF3088 domain-containing protein [Pseudomonadota bacterium]
MERDKLIILKPDFQDPAYPDQTFYCWHCALMEGLLSCYPDMANKLDVQRISWPKPRQELIDLVGPENQSVPILILADDAPAGLETGSFNGRRFVDEKDAILRALSIRYGIADPHP